MQKYLNVGFSTLENFYDKRHGKKVYIFVSTIIEHYENIKKWHAIISLLVLPQSFKDSVYQFDRFNKEKPFFLQELYLNILSWPQSYDF